MVRGAGATFPAPLYEAWVAAYRAVAPQLRLNYQAVGSGAGLRQVFDGTTDFAASDVALTDEQVARAGRPLLHVPLTLGVVAVAFHVPTVGPLDLAPDVLADAYLGVVTRWDDPRIAATNPGVTLPSLPIVPVYRSDGSGSTAIFSEYLARRHEAFAARIGRGTQVRFGLGVGAKGNDGVTTQIQTTPGALGYVELLYARHGHLTTARLRNAAGLWVAPSNGGATAAAAATDRALGERHPEDLRVSLVDGPGDDAYPLSAYSFVLVPEEFSAGGEAKGRALAGFLWWALHEGQKVAPSLDYAALPIATVTRAEARLRLLRAGDHRLLDPPPSP